MSFLQQTPAVHGLGVPSSLQVGDGETPGPHCLAVFARSRSPPPALLPCEGRTAAMPTLTWIPLAGR
jgi:hypothetical protein